MRGDNDARWVNKLMSVRGLIVMKDFSKSYDQNDIDFWLRIKSTPIAL